MKELAIKIRHRCNTKEIWESANPKLEKGEIGIQIPSQGDADNPKARWFFKFGDGEHLWKELPWAAAEGDVDETLEKEGFAADAKATGDAIKELSDKIDVANYKALALSLSVNDGNIRERTSNFPTSITLTTKYSGAKPKDNRATVEAKIGNPYPQQTITNFNNKTVTFNNLDISMDFMKLEKPILTFELSAIEAACVGNGKKEISRKQSVSLEFKDYVYYGYSATENPTLLEKGTEFIKALSKIKDFGLVKSNTMTTPKDTGEFYYFCVPYYYKKIEVVAGVTPLDVDNLGTIDFDYDNELLIPYTIYRTKNKYYSGISIGFTVAR